MSYDSDNDGTVCDADPCNPDSSADVAKCCKDSDKAKWFLYQRDKTTLSLVKLQAKLVLYAAGVGPLADAAFAITDRIDLVELQKALSDFDLAQFAEDVKKMDIREIQAAIIGAVRSFIGL